MKNDKPKEITRDTFVKAGRKGGTTTMKLHGTEHFRTAVKKRWELKKKQCKLKSK